MNLICPKSISIFISFLIIVSIKAQNTYHNLKISIKLENFSEDGLFLEIDDLTGRSTLDTFKKHANGQFTLSTYIERPSTLFISSSSKFMYSFYAGPGCALFIKSDVSDYETLRHTTSVSGVGSENIEFDNKLTKYVSSWSIKVSDDDTNLVHYTSELKRFLFKKDSVLLSVFKANIKKDPYFIYFRNLKLKDNYFSTINFFLSYADKNNLSFKTSDSILRRFFQFKDEMLIDSNLSSSEFKEFVTNFYLYHILNSDLQASNDIIGDRFHAASKIIKQYHGQIKDYALSRYFVYAISNSKSYTDYNNYVSHYEICKSEINNSYLDNRIDDAINRKKTELSESEVDVIAPNFAGIDSTGKNFDISGFNGKVVYIDLWASWCLPCRKETPYLELIYNYFKNNSDLVILSISVFDRPVEWRKAVEQDNPKWLQLFDDNGSVARFFTGNLEIPRFILINKLGKIVSFNAPFPHEKETIINLISKELEK